VPGVGAQTVTIDTSNSGVGTYAFTYEYRSSGTVVDPPDGTSAYVNAPAILGSYSGSTVRGININGGIDHTGANRGSLVTAAVSSTVTGNNSLGVVSAMGSATAQTEDAMLTSSSGNPDFKFQADSSSAVRVYFTIAGFTQDINLNGLFSASSQAIHDPVPPPFSVGGVLITPDPGAFAIGSASFSLTRDNTRIASGGVGATRGNYTYNNQNLGFSGRLAPGTYSFSVYASATSYSAQTSDPLGSRVRASGSFSGVNLSLTPGPALSGSVIGGVHQVAIGGGGAGTVGGITTDFDQVGAAGGVFSEAYQTTTEADLLTVRPELLTGAFDLKLAGDAIQLWDLDFTGTHSGQTQLVFHYDPTLLSPDVAESDLRIAHFINGEWVLQNGTVDTTDDTITINTDSFSPFALSANPVEVPEPTSVALAGLGVAACLFLRRRRR
jgi:hypothetical protein